MTRSLRLGPALGGATAFLPKAWANAWAILALAAAVLAAPAFADRIDPQLKPWMAAPFAVVALAVRLALQGALYRIGTTASTAEARRAGLGLGGLQFRLTELRLLAAGVLVALFLGMVALTLGMVAVFVLTGLAVGDLGLIDPASLVRDALGGEGRAIVLCLLAAGAAWVLALLAVRLSLFRAATVARGRIVTVGALSLAQGAFWSLFAGLILVLSPAILVGAWQAGWLGHDLIMPVSSEVYALIRAVALAFIQVPLAIGFLSYAYNRLEYGD